MAGMWDARHRGASWSQALLLTSMADESIRRSGRATKGVHTKDREDSESGPKSKGKKGGKKGKNEPEPEPEEENEIIRCICGQYEEEEDEPRAMICCDKCQAWEHNDCMGLPEDYAPDKYFCEQCKPSQHKELLAAMKRGEKPWIDAEIRREQIKAEKEAKKKGKKGGRKSGARASEVRTPTVEPEEPVTSRKRKLEESPVPADSTKVGSLTAFKVNQLMRSQNKRARSSLRESTNGAEEQKEEEAAAAAAAEEDDAPMDGSIFADVAKDPKELEPKRNKSATGLAKVFSDQAVVLTKNKSITLAKGEDAKSLGNQIALRVEHAVYHVKSGGYGEPSEAYTLQVRAILYNIKINADLATRSLNRQLGAEELAAMDPADMATDEQKQKDAEEKLKMEKQHIMVEDPEGPRIRRTHKGDEYVDDSGQPAESATNNAPVRKESTIDQDAEMKSPTSPVAADKPNILRKPSASTKRGPFSDPRRKSSASFDINKINAGIPGAPSNGETPKLSEARQEGSPPPLPNAGGDPDIDRMLEGDKPEAPESPPYEPPDFEAGVVWHGKVNGGSLGTFSTSAKFAAGCQPDVENLGLTWSRVIPQEIKLHGRIQPAKADEYLCGLEYSNTTELVIVQLTRPKTMDDVEQFDKFFEYLRRKDRYGVGSQHQDPAIKDIYLLPMEVGQPLPTVMKALEHSLDDPVTERHFLVPIVIKWTELPHNAERVKQQQLQQQQQTTQSPSAGPPVAQTPITPHEPQMMQFDGPPPQPAFGQPPTNNGAPALASYSTPPPPAQPQQQTQPHAPVLQQSQAPAAYTALRILGPTMSALPAVIELVTQAPNAGEQEFTVIKECLEENEEAGRNLPVLTQMLQMKYQSSREQKGASQGGQPAAPTST